MICFKSWKSTSKASLNPEALVIKFVTVTSMSIIRVQ